MLRPIGLAESLLKIGEGAKLEPWMPEVRRRMEPNQLDVGTPDRVVLAVMLLRSWADAIMEAERTDQISESPSAMCH